MKVSLFTILIFIWCVACKNEREAYSDNMKMKPESELKFDKEKWNTKEGKHYPYRMKMVNDIVYNDTIRSLSKDEIIDLLGEPSYYRGDKNFLYYRVHETNVGAWTTYSRTIVIKIAEDNSVDWIKVHE